MNNKKNDDREKRLTEQFDDRFKGLDEWPTKRLLSTILEDQIKAVDAMRSAVPAIDRAVIEASLRLSGTKGRLVYIGAGTPARLGVQDGTELTPTYGWSPLRMAFVIAGGRKALFEAVEGAEDDAQKAREEIRALKLTKDDVCIAVSASGTTPYTVAACEEARKAGALTIGISSNAGGALNSAADIDVYLDSGAEPVGGSTRMNAGTVQKIALNMLSTGIMVRLGHVFDGLMVDMKLTNEKLRQRAVRMVCRITGCDEIEAADALRQSEDVGDANVKLAVLIVGGLTAEEGANILNAHNGHLRHVLKHIKF